MDRAQFEKYLFWAVEQYDILLFTWNLIPNHFHLFIQTLRANLSKFMHALMTKYARYFNRRHGYLGHVFQERYGAKVCDKESYFLEVTRYVLLNSNRTKAQLGGKKGWKWSGHRYLMMPTSQWPAPLKRAFQEVLERFGSTPSLARKNLNAFLLEGLKKDNWQTFYKPRQKIFIGDDAFISKAKSKSLQKPLFDEEPFAISIDELVELVSSVSGIHLSVNPGC